MKLIKVFSVFFLVLFSQNVFSQYTDVINSNRPGASRSAFSVGTNVLQFEVGPYIVNEEHTPLKQEVSGFGIDFAARYGLLFEELELKIEGTYQNDTFTDNRGFIPLERDRANFKNLTVGAKYLVYDPYKNAEEEQPNLYSYHANRKFSWNSLIPAVAVYAGANFDSEDNSLLAPGVEGVSPRLMVATQNNFAGGWVFIMNLISDRLGTENSEFQYILTLTHSFNPQWVLFAETQGIKSDFYADNLFRFGGAYLWTKNFQLDTGITLNTKDTPSVFNFNFGASYRFDFHEDKEMDDDSGNNKKPKKKKKKKKRKKKKDDVIDFDDDSL